MSVTRIARRAGLPALVAAALAAALLRDICP